MASGIELKIGDYRCVTALNCGNYHSCSSVAPPCLIADSSPVAHVAETQLAPILVGALSRKVEGVLHATRRIHETTDEEARYLP